MRPRKWVLILTCCIFSLSLVLFLLKRNIERNRKLENLLIEAVTSSSLGTFSVDAIRVGFFSFYLHNVAVSLPQQNFSLKIRNIKVGISFSKLFKNRGDISRAINQVILIKPQLDLTLAPPPSNKTSAAPSQKKTPARASGTLTGSPVQFLFIKNGIIRLVDERNDTTILARKCAGKLSGTPRETSVSLTGHFGSSRKENFSMQGMFSSARNEHHVSLRFSNAGLKKPLSLSSVTFQSGVLNGAIECTFGNQFTPETSELNGWLQFSEGRALLGPESHPLDSILFRLSLENTTCNITTLSAVFRGMPLSIRGSYRFTGTQPVLLQVSCPRVIPDSLYGFIPRPHSSHIAGEGSLSGTVAFEKNRDPTFSITAGGISLYDLNIRHLLAFGHLSGTRVMADSVVLNAGLLSAQAQGYYDLDSSGQSYDIGFTINADSFPDSSAFSGTVLAIGTATGSPSGTPVINCRISARSLMYEHIHLGNPQLIAKFMNNRCSFRSVAIDSSTSVVVLGSIDSVFSPVPEANFNVTIESGPINEQLKRMHGIPPVDSAHLVVSGSGWINDFSASLELALQMKLLSGILQARVNRHPDDTGLLVWEVNTTKMRYKNIPLTFSGRGMVRDSFLVIDTISGYDGIYGKARIYHTATPPSVDAKLTFNKKIADLLSLINDNPPLTAGTVSGHTRITGAFDSLKTFSRLALRNVGNSELKGFSTELTIRTRGGSYTIYPTVVLRDKHEILTLDTISNTGGHLRFEAAFKDLTPEILLGSLIPSSTEISASLTGFVRNSPQGLPLQFSMKSPSVVIDHSRLDSVNCRGTFSDKGITVEWLDFKDGKRSVGRATGFIPWPFLGADASDRDTLRGTLTIKGDLLATIEKNFDSPIGGSGRGAADLSFYTAGGNWRFTRGTISLPRGILHVTPFVPDKVKNFTFLMTIDSLAGVHTDMSGTIRRKPIRIFSEHRLPDGYEPLMIGPLNFGMFQVETPRKGVVLHLPGFMATKDKGGIDFRGRSPFEYFTISGPLDRIKLTGTWILRDLEFTFPFLPSTLDWDVNPFPYVTWEMDIRPGNRRVMYFWDLAGKRNRIMRFVEGFLDPSSSIRVRGRDLDKTFRIYGTIRSYKGAAYYGRVFDRNFDVGVEFNPQKPQKNAPYDNMPLLWGSAETFADTSRHDRIKLTCMVTDPTTGAVSEKGRLANQSTPNITFHLSSDFDELPGESEREYYRQAGITFTTLEGAGSAVSHFGEQLFHRYLLQRWERRIAKKLGLDVINIESSIVSNYFNKLYGRQFDGLLNEDDYLALANVGVTVGRYFFRDFLFLKARGELIPIDMALTPEYSVGFEFQPSRFLTMDVNYGFHRTETAIRHSPLLMMQLRLPITRLRNLWKF